MMTSYQDIKNDFIKENMDRHNASGMWLFEHTFIHFEPFVFKTDSLQLYYPWEVPILRSSPNNELSRLDIKLHRGKTPCWKLT